MKDNWKNNKIQFPRLIAEMEALGIFNQLNLKTIGEEMDLTEEQICEIVTRAQKEWDKIKSNI